MRKVKVQLISDDDPKVFDAETGEDLTANCNRIEILPGRVASILVRGEDGLLVLDTETNDRPLTQEYQVVEISGRWLGRGQE